jgi:hypothetical protein
MAMGPPEKRLRDAALRFAFAPLAIIPGKILQQLWQSQDRGGPAAGRRVPTSVMHLVFAVERVFEARVIARAP